MWSYKGGEIGCFAQSYSPGGGRYKRYGQAWEFQDKYLDKYPGTSYYIKLLKKLNHWDNCNLRVLSTCRSWSMSRNAVLSTSDNFFVRFHICFILVFYILGAFLITQLFQASLLDDRRLAIITESLMEVLWTSIELTVECMALFIWNKLFSANVHIAIEMV